MDSGSYIGVVREIRTGLVRCRGGRRRLPPRYVDSVEVLGHLGDHGGLQAAIGVAGVLALEAALEDAPQLLRLGVTGVLNLEMAALGNDLLGSEGALRVPPSFAAPPLLDLGHLLGEQLVLPARIHGGISHIAGGHDGQDFSESLF